jgi:hypothetical protein
MSPAVDAEILTRTAAFAFRVSTADIHGVSKRLHIAAARNCAVGLVWFGDLKLDGAPVKADWVSTRFGGRSVDCIAQASSVYRRWCAAMGEPLHFDSALRRARRIAAHLGFPTVNEQEITAMDGALVDIFPTAPGKESRGFGDFELGSLDDLPQSMWREAIELTLERVRSFCPDHVAALLLAAERLGSTPAAIKRVLALPMARQAVPDDEAASEGCRPLPRRSADDGFAAFAEAHLVGDGRGEVQVASGFATYRRFCRRAGIRPAERGNFGFLLLKHAKPLGGVRSGDTITGIALVEAVSPPRCEAVKAARPVPPMASAERCSVLPRPLGIAAPVADPEPDPDRDDLEVFLEERLVQLPGEVLSLESLKQAARSEGLSFRDIIARAKDRGHQVRKNPWGPDFLTDATLVEARA